MAHGSFYIPGKAAEDDHVFKLEEVKTSGMDYLALGHWHEIYKCSEKPPAWYCGPPEWIPDQKEKGGVLLISVSDAGEVKVEPKMLGLRDYDEIPPINVSDIHDLAKLKEKILQGANQNLVRKITLTGLRDAELIINPEELEDLQEKFFHLSIIDESHPKLGEVTEDEERLIRNRFIKLMKEQIEGLEGEEKEIAENALQYGLIFLDGKEV
jgi:DNA repair exonuclease SbcCD nuclease subunit